MRIDGHGHGSAEPVPGTAVRLWATGLVSWRDWRATAAAENPIERAARIKRAPGSSEETFTRLAGLIRRRRIE